MNEYIEKKYIEIVKGIAIFCVVCAHVATVVPNSDIFSVLCGKILDMIGTMGVPIFFILSGYLFCYEKRKIGTFWKRKLVSIVIPWVFCDTIIYLYVTLRKGTLNLFEWFKFIGGVNHSTYYLTVLLVFYLIFWKWKKNKVFLSAMILISLLSLYLTISGKMPSYVNTFFQTTYMNPFNWCIYFIIGIFIHKGGLEKISEICFHIFPFMFLLLLGNIVAHIIFEIPYFYWSKFALINIPISCIVILGAGRINILSKVKVLNVIGRYSYTIYLLNMLFAGGVVWLTGKIDCFLLVIIRPFIIIMIILCGVWIVSKIKKQKMKHLVYILLGIR